MRTLALAEAWGALGSSAVFVSRCTSAALRAHAQARGFSVVALEAEPGSLADLDEAVAVLSVVGKRKGCLCLDGYEFGPDYQRRARAAGWPVLVIDDMAHQPEYHADILHNQNLEAERLAYRVNTGAELLFGPRYALLRPEFLAVDHGSQAEMKDRCRVLVTFGGSDPAGLTISVVRALASSRVSGLQVTVLVGSTNNRTVQLEREVAAAGTRFRLVRDTGDMPRLMRDANLAVSAAGSTCWELCHLGVPAVLLVAAENQRGIAAALDRSGAALSLGWHTHVTPELIQSAVESLAGAPKQRAAMARAGRALVDGKGAQRVAGVLARRFPLASGASG